MSFFIHRLCLPPDPVYAKTLHLLIQRPLIFNNMKHTYLLCKNHLKYIANMLQIRNAGARNFFRGARSRREATHGVENIPSCQRPCVFRRKTILGDAQDCPVSVILCILSEGPAQAGSPFVICRVFFCTASKASQRCTRCLPFPWLCLQGRYPPRKQHKDRRPGLPPRALFSVRLSLPCSDSISPRRNPAS